MCCRSEHKSSLSSNSSSGTSELRDHQMSGSPNSVFCDLSLCGRFLGVCFQEEYHEGVSEADWAEGETESWCHCNRGLS